jgi:hypothetical protein
VRSAHRPDDPRISVVVCDVEGGPLAARLRQYFPDPNTLFIGHDREGLHDAMREVPCAALVALTTCPRVSPPKELMLASRTWPMASLIWFERHTQPAQPQGKGAHLPAGTQLIGPWRE